MEEHSDCATLLLHRFALSLGITLAIFLGIIVFDPSARSAFSSEDQFLENLTVVMYLFGFLLGTFTLIKSRRLLSGWILIPVIGLVGALEELSFGSRLFDWSMPVVNGVRIDALHDFIDLVGVTASQDKLVMVGLGAAAVLGLFFVFHNDRRRSFLANLPQYFKNAHPVGFAFFGISVLVVSVGLDISFQKGWPLHHWIQSGAPVFGVETGLTRRMFFLVEELLEFSASYAVLFSNISLGVWAEFLQE